MRKIEKNLNIKGARTHNLKNIDVSIPLNNFVIVKGPSGSGKSSLVFHTIYSESKRRLINSLPTDVKFFWDIPNRSDVDDIRPVFPVWGLMQNNPIVGSRPSVSDLLGITEKLQNLFFYFGKLSCPTHKEPLVRESSGEVKKIFLKIKGRAHLFVEKDLYKSISNVFPSRVFEEEIKDFNEDAELWEFGRYKNTDHVKCLNELENLFSQKKISNNSKIYIADSEGSKLYSLSLEKKYNCSKCDFSFRDELLMDLLSPYNAHGACSTCKGHGYVLKLSRNKIVKNASLSINDGAINFLMSSHFSYCLKDFKKVAKDLKIDLDAPFEQIESEKLWEFIEKGKGKFEGVEKLFTYLEPYRYKRSVRIFMRSYQEEILCDSCEGTRLSEVSKLVMLGDDKVKIDLQSCYKKKLKGLVETFESLKLKNKESHHIYSEIIKTLNWAEKLGLGYISLIKKAKNLSVAEYQRILLVKYLQYDGSGSVFVLDEPTIGLSLDEQKVLSEGIRALVNNSNTVIAVDHSDVLEKDCDHLIEMGPGAGTLGGSIIYQGGRKNISKKKATIKKYPETRSRGEVTVSDIPLDEFQKVSVTIPLDRINLVRGDSGVGKNKVFFQGVANTIQHHLFGESDFEQRPLKKFKTDKTLEDCIVLDTKISRYSVRSTVGSYLDLSPYLRKYFSKLEISKALGLKDGHFSSNSELGQCTTCSGTGINVVNMQFLEDLQMTCEDCKGKKIKSHIANISDGHKRLWQYYQEPLSEVFKNIPLTPKAKRILDLLERFNLSHLSLERELGTLSGGEILRVKLISQLMKKSFKNTILFFENVSYGLSHLELKILLEYFEQLRYESNTLVVIDNHPLFLEIGQVIHEFKRNQSLMIDYKVITKPD